MRGGLRWVGGVGLTSQFDSIQFLELVLGVMTARSVEDGCVHLAVCTVDVWMMMECGALENCVESDA